MKRIGVTQRIEVAHDYEERRDSLDQAWTALFCRLGWDALPVPNVHEDVVAWARRQQLDGLLLSGGNDLCHLPDANRPAPERDATEVALLHWAQLSEIPVLGVCRGMQMINYFLGGTLIQMTGHIACRHSVQASTSLRTGGQLISYHEVNSFHGWGISLEGLAPGLIPLLQAADGSLECVQHEFLPWCGIMWHPEREDETAVARDLQLITAVFEKRSLV